MGSEYPRKKLVNDSSTWECPTNIEHDAGFRGIGRLAGIAFCDALKFRTSAKGESKATVLEFDCVGIRKAISPANRRILEMADVLAKYVTESTEQAKPGDHFLEVTLAGISDSATEFWTSRMSAVPSAGSPR